MPLDYLSGDPLLTQAHILAFGHNKKGRTETTPLATALLDRYPAALANYARQCRKGRIKSGMLWMWHDAQPILAALVVRDSAVGATRLRNIEAVAMTIARDYLAYDFKSIAIAPLGTTEEWLYIKPVLDHWLADIPIPIIVYENYLPGVAAETS